MEVDASHSSPRHYPQEIDQLLEVFGSMFSIDCITSTYLQANHDVDRAGEILCELQTTASTASHQTKEDTEMSPRVSSGTCNPIGFELLPCVAEGHSTALDLGEEYARPGSSTREQFYHEGSLLPMGTEEPIISDLLTKTSPSSGGVTTEVAQKDVDEFLFKMLGDGFQLDMKLIHEVLSTCGYDMEKSMETLLDKSASALGKSDDILSKAPEVARDSENLIIKRPSKGYEEIMDLSCQGKSQHKSTVRSSKKRNKDKNGLEKEIWQSLFTASKIPEEEPKKSRPSSGRFGRVVTEPLEDTPIEHKTLHVTPLQTSKDEDDEGEDSFHVLRRAVMEHWATMKEYYKAAGEALLKGDNARAKRLMEQGHFFSQKAREVDAISLQQIVETREEEELLLDFSNLEPKESIQHLRSQLNFLCGIPSISNLKVKLGNGEGGAKEATRKKLILKQLEKESIKWTEMETGTIILTRVDEISPESLSFFKR